jgi:purine-nucleoside/S-methyl-5'-thioadenosine phosphorylase / adenosine deaminase
MIKRSDELWLWADWPVPDHIHAGTSTRRGGHSKAPYNELNLAYHVGDEPDSVIKNRNVLIDHLGLNSEPAWLNQTHSSDIISIETSPTHSDADGSFTTKANKICTIMTADCVPILFCNKQGTKIAAIHAGWKGICKGIVSKALEQFRDPKSILVWVGPCISSEHYEVGKDVYEACFNLSASLNDGFNQINKDHWYCDLVKIVSILLKNAGVGSIYECGLCTYKMDDLFYSYRRDGMTGRTASMIWME